MNTLKLTYGGDQHATALKEPNHHTVAIDCPYTAKGKGGWALPDQSEFSSRNENYGDVQLRRYQSGVIDLPGGRLWILSTH